MSTEMQSNSIEFEVHQLMLMRNIEDGKQTKLAEFGISLEDADRISQQVHQKLKLGTEQFSALKLLLGAQDVSATTITYSSRFWPQFEFAAESTNFGTIGPARYQRVAGNPPTVSSPTELPLWSVTVDEFSQLFGPLQSVDSWYPNEEYTFEFAGDKYGVGFCWGLYLGVDRL
ncbi:hypothetical protein [Nocardia huaxiensis]|uniref:hypothetical protein n=1 Tax=Nocardia huaxiensis TaxID=2755382 RepID=UPI001E4A28F4|nr:hypothetical protein [Nocardia huaxiensis]UFS96371.1 hypothetical protein LPY97_00010 [Nocardia huaxiensis]